MITEFVQKRGFNSRKFMLTSEKIIVETKTLRKNNKYEVKLDRLGLDIHYQSDNTMPGKIFSGVCATLVIGSIFGIFYSNDIDSKTWTLNALLWTLLACIPYFKQHQDDIYLLGGETNLVFYRDIPIEKNVLEFIDGIRANIKVYLKEKYTVFDDTIPEQEFYNRINWLRDREIISYAEYLEYKTNFETHKLL